jgi:hypothetical protein
MDLYAHGLVPHVMVPQYLAPHSLVPHSLVPHSLVERLFFFSRQRTNSAFGEFTERQRTDRNPHQSQHRNAKRRQHPPNVAALALV